MLLLLRFLRFFLENPKKRDYVFCFASHVFSNYDYQFDLLFWRKCNV